MKILILEDDSDIRKNLVKALEKRGHLVATALNGHEGLSIFFKHFEKEPFDMVLTDIKMPVMDGIEFLRKLRQDTTETPVIIMTGHGDIDLSVKALRLGAFDFIIKPFKISSLDHSLEQIDNLLHLKRKPLGAIPFITRNELELSIPSKSELVDSVVSFFQVQLEPICKKYMLGVSKLTLCLIESLSNALIHGNLEISSKIKEEDFSKFNQLKKEREADPNYANRQIVVRFCLDPDRFKFEIRDEGKGFDTTQLPDINDPLAFLDVSGRGLFLIRSYMDDVSWNKIGNCLYMEKHLGVISEEEEEE